MNKRNKRFLILSVAVVSILLLVGITYALNYTQTGTNQKMILGDIWMNYRESNGINLENVVPGADYSDYFEFTIEGTNTYTKKDIWYEVLITRGDKPIGKTEENRILDKFLLFKLVEVNGESETEIFKDKSYSNLNNQRVYVETIGKGVSNYSKTYRLYATLSDELVIGNTVDSDLDFDEFALAFASIKVNVAGDFNEKDLSTDVECFNAVKIIDSYTYNNSDEAVSVCAAYLEEQGFAVEEITYENYCKGTDSNNSLEATINKFLYLRNIGKYDFTNLEKTDIDYFIANNIMTDVVYGASIIGYDETCGPEVEVPKTIAGYPVLAIYGTIYENMAYDYSSQLLSFEKLTSNNVQNVVAMEECELYNRYQGAFFEVGVTNITLPDSIKYIGPYAFNNGLAGSSFHYSTDGNKNVFDRIKLPNNLLIIGESAFAGNDLIEITIPEKVQEIGSSAFMENKLIEINIPNSVTSIGSGAFSFNSLETVKIGTGVTKINPHTFSENQIQTLLLPNTITYIDTYAFSDNDLRTIDIPDSVTYIGIRAFANNSSLSEVTIGNGINFVHTSAFIDGDYTHNLTSITFDKTCNEIESIFDYSYQTDYSSTKIYGSNNEVCK